MAAEANLNKPLYKIELYLLKVIPMIMAALHLANTTLFYFGIDLEILSYLGGVSFLTLGFLYLSSYVFKFCEYHRMFLHYVVVTNLICIYDTCTPLGAEDVGFTHTNPSKRTSIVGIAATSSQEEFLNTIVHEAKHVQSHICAYYDVPEDGEQAAYLIGYIVQRMHRIFKNMIGTGIR